jgi:hypothetical protein
MKSCHLYTQIRLIPDSQFRVQLDPHGHTFQRTLAHLVILSGVCVCVCVCVSVNVLGLSILHVSYKTSVLLSWSRLWKV